MTEPNSTTIPPQTHEMTTNPINKTGEQRQHRQSKHPDAEITTTSWDNSDTESELSKNPKSISWCVIFASALANFSDGYQNNLVQGQGVHDMMWYMTIARGITGVGVGGEYPPSAAAALEGSNEHYDHLRGPIQVLVSTLMATSAAPICTAIYLITLCATSDNLKTAFHAIYAISIFLPLFVALLRFNMRDGILFRRNNFRNQFTPPYLLVLKRYGWRLLGTSSAFFVYDFINFPNSIMSSAIINEVVPGKDVRQTAIWQFILALLAVPGPIIGSYLCNKIGRKWTGIAGWIGYIILGFVIGACYNTLTSHIAAFVVLYGLMQSLGHMGPGATIGLMSVELYPTAIRGMSYGISAAFGKAGAAIGTQVFTPIRDAAGPASTFYLLGGLSVLGVAIYWLLPEGRDIDLGVEDESFGIYLKGKGWE
ncbi:MFS general substrate transporter, partial [Aureobasidium pullulans]